MWSATQPTAATSSGEAELIAMAEGASRGSCLRTMMVELGFGPKVQVVHMATDSSVAKSFVSTRGLGKMRHLDVKLLWLQEMCAEGYFERGQGEWRDQRRRCVDKVPKM